MNKLTASRLLSLGLLSLLLLGCGNKGALYMPEDPTKQEKSSPQRAEDNQ